MLQKVLKRKNQYGNVKQITENTFETNATYRFLLVTQYLISINFISSTAAEKRLSNGLLVMHSVISIVPSLAKLCRVNMRKQNLTLAIQVTQSYHNNNKSYVFT